MAENNIKPTVNDVASAAGVSLATVDRVLNERPGVRTVTRDKVLSAVTQLGYVRDSAAANLARQRHYRLVFVLPDTNNEFVQALERDIDKLDACKTLPRTTLACQKISPFNHCALVAVLDGLDAAKADGVSFLGPDTPEVRGAIKRTRERGIAVTTLVADLPGSQRHHFIGIDNVAAGRTAARLMGRFMAGSGKIVIITGSRLANDHQQRISGFKSVMTEDYPGIDVITTLESRDDPDIVHKLVPEFIATNSQINGIYSAAAGNPGLIRYLQETGRHEDMVVVAHELTDSSQGALASGIFDAVISQDSARLVRSATRLLMATADQFPFDLSQEHIPIDIHLSENMPATIQQNQEMHL